MDKQELHKRSSIPLFLQVVSALRGRIESGIWPPGSKLPSLEELAEEFSVARATARQAVSELEAEGMIWRKQGKGTFVNESFQDKRWLNVMTNWEDMARDLNKGAEVSPISSSDDAGLPYFRTKIGEPADSYRYMKNLQYRDGKPFGVFDIYLESSIYKQNPKAYDGKVVIAALYSAKRVTTGSIHQILIVGAADIENANLLEVAIDTPTVNMRRIVLGKDGKIVYFADCVFPANIVKIEMDVK